MSRRVALVLSLLLVPLAAGAARREPERMLQATLSQRGWVASIDQRRATLQAPDGSRQSFRVRRDERWLELAEFDNGWMAAGIRASKEGLDLRLVANFGRGIRRLPEPGDRRGALRTRPTPIVSPSGPQGLAWLEGDSPRSLAVRVATLEDGAFGVSETVSPPAAGSQTGLRAAVLEDGTWLLVWSRFDGHDDEIVWATRAPGGDWTAVRRLAPDNSTPDITPWLLPSGNGAVIAWSRLAGEYEVFTSRFANGSWSTPRSLGAQGTLTPTFRRFRGSDFLLVRNAWPAGWTAFRFDDAGQAVDFAVVAEESSAAPVLRVGAGSAVALEWAGSNVTPLRWEHEE